MKKTVITISREHGSGGRMIAAELSKLLGIPYYDKQVIALAAEESGLPEAVILRNEQRKTSSFLYSLYMSTQVMPIPDRVYIAQQNVIKTLSERESCIIVGRCADYILRDDPDLFRVFIHAPLEERIKRVHEVYGTEDGNVEERNLEKFILRKDKQRADFYNYCSGMKWGHYKNYDLIINSTVGIETAAQIIKTALGL